MLKQIEISVDPKSGLKRDLDLKKKFSIQKIHGGAFFSPKDNFLTIPPQEVSIFPMYVKIPKRQKKGRMHIEFYSENSWGMTNIFKGGYCE